MIERRADAIAALVVATVVVVGAALSWQAYQRQRAFDQMGSMMGTSMAAVHGTNPLWYVLGTLLVASVIGGTYLIMRDALPVEEASEQHSDEPSGPATEGDTTSLDDPRPGETSQPEGRPRSRVLDILPDDERRVLEPVLTSPGITQIELRDRSDFSKSKVSQTVSELEKRGLLYRERQGRTYRIYPNDDLRQDES